MKAVLPLVLCVTIFTHSYQQTIGSQTVIKVPYTSSGRKTNALLYLPEQYNGVKKFPLIIYLHGNGGGKGDSLHWVKGEHLPHLIAEGWKPKAINPADGNEYEFIVFSPQSPQWSYSYNQLKYMLPYLIENFQVDISRLYITGTSAGGAGVWSCITMDTTFCKKFAAIAPISSAGLNTQPEYDNLVNAAKYKVAVWDIVGDQDAFYTLNVNYVNKINSADPVQPAKLTPLPGVGHGAAKRGYDPEWKTDNLNLYEWLLQFNRSGNPQSANILPVAKAGRPITLTLPHNSLQLDGKDSYDTDGKIKDYEWKKISGPDQFTLNKDDKWKATLSNLTAGEYKILLTVTDDKNAKGRDTLKITVASGPLREPDNVSNTTNGLSYKYYEGNWTKLPDFDNLTPVKTGTASHFDLSVKQKNNRFGLVFTGYFDAPSNGQYTFYAASDDGSKLYIGNTLVINNDGLHHNRQVRSGTIGLKAGKHAITVAYFKKDGNGRSLLVSFAGPDIPKEKVPGSQLFYVSSDKDDKKSDDGKIMNSGQSNVEEVDNRTASIYKKNKKVSNTIASCGGKKIYLEKRPDNGFYMHAKNFSYQPGDTLVLKASSNPWSYFSLDGFHGTASCPVVIINEGGQVSLANGISLINCTYMKVTGTGSSSNYGLYIHDYNSPAITVRGRSAHIEIEHVSIYNQLYGFWVKEEASCDDSLQFPNWVIDGIKIHHNKIVNVHQEGMYLGSTDPNGTRAINCNGTVIYPKPLRLANISVHDNIIDSTWRGGIQLSSAEMGYNEIYNNTITRCGYEYNYYQGNGIILGGYTHALIHHNSIDHTYSSGIFSLGAGLIRIKHNTVNHSGTLDGKTTSGMASIMIDTRNTTNPSPGNENPVKTTFRIKYNTLGSNTDANIRVYDTYKTYTADNVICGNTLFDGSDPSLRVATGISYTDCAGISRNSSEVKTTNTKTNKSSVKNYSIQLYPNPAKDVLNVKLNEEISGKVLLNIYNEQGRLLQTKTIYKNVSSSLETLDISKLNAGLHVLQLMTEKQKVYLKFIKLN